MSGINDCLLTSTFSFFGRYVCIQGASQSQPPGDPTGRKCPAGFYCPAGTSHMHPCPPGTFSSLKGLIHIFIKLIFYSLYSNWSLINKQCMFLSIIRHAMCNAYCNMRNWNICSNRGNIYFGVPAMSTWSVLCRLWVEFTIWPLQPRILLQSQISVPYTAS